MKLVVDTNIIFSALISGGKTREILIESNLDLYAPEYLYTETINHEQTIKNKSNLDKVQIETLLNLVLENIEIIPREEYRDKHPAAKKLIADKDPDDVPFLALALQKDANIWSDDKHLQKQEKVKVWTTTELIRKLQL